NVPNVASVGTPPGGGLGVSVGSPAAPVIGATLTPTCTGLQVLNIQLGTCQNPPGPAPTTPPSLLGGLTGTLGGLLGG
ncbi:MAG: hypothetical protein M3Y91_16275, partial [Actinomycetota bacterium]|nr:hypothetical protein [Actinomycetota bacterium]